MADYDYGQLIDDFELGVDVMPEEDLTAYIERRRREFESKADGGAIGIEILFGPKRENFRKGGDTIGGKNDKSKTSKGPDRSRVSAQQQSNHDRAMAAAQNNGGGGITNTINNINKTTVFDKAKNLANKVVDSPLTAFIDPRSKLALAMGGYKYLRDGVTPFQQKSIDEELESIQTKGGIVPYADGGRAGYVSGGAALKLLEKGKEGIASLYSAGKGKFDEFVETMSQSKKPSESFTSQNITTDLIDGPITVEKMANLDSKTLDIIKNTYDNGLYKEMPEILKAGNLLERFTKVVKGERIVDYERAESILGVPLKGDETLNEIFKIEFNTRPVEKLADGGRVGLFMGGDPLDGQALSIYNSMNAYGFSEQEIANALQEQGLYTPGSTPDVPDTTIQPIGFQSGNGGGGGGITELDPLNRPKGTPFDLNSLTKTKFGYNNALGRTIEGVKDFTGSMIDKFSGSKIGEGITSGATKFKNMAFTPMMALMQKRNPLNPSATNYNPNLQKQMDFLEGTTGTRVFGTSDNLQFEDAAMIGRDPNSGLAKYGPGSVLSGQNVVSGFGTNDYEEQLANYVEKMRNRAITKTLTKFQQQKLDAAMAELGREKARQEKDAADKARAANADVYAELDKRTGGKGYGDAGGFSTSRAGKEGAFGTFGEGRGRKDFSEGGLATMFKEKR